MCLDWYMQGVQYYTLSFPPRGYTEHFAFLEALKEQWGERSSTPLHSECSYFTLVKIHNSRKWDSQSLWAEGSPGHSFRYFWSLWNQGNRRCLKIRELCNYAIFVWFTLRNKKRYFSPSNAIAVGIICSPRLHSFSNVLKHDNSVLQYSRK